MNLLYFLDMSFCCASARINNIIQKLPVNTYLNDISGYYPYPRVII